MKYQSDRKACFLSHNGFGGSGLGSSGALLPNPENQTIDLLKSDYENIRYLVTQIWSSHGIINGFETKEWMKAKGFRNY